MSVNSLERINQRLGDSAEAFLDDLPVPPAETAGKILVLTADGKGVPMTRESTAPVPAFERREFPGNRKMAILAGSLPSLRTRERRGRFSTPCSARHPPTRRPNGRSPSARSSSAV